MNASQTGKKTFRSQAPEYKAWRSMLRRVERSPYAERGTAVCDRWRGSFDNFLEDLGERPEGTVLGLADGAGNFEPGNCRWMTPSETLEKRPPNPASLAALKLAGGPPPKHGYSRRDAKSPTYNIWCGIKTRTMNPNTKAYPHYGGRGITICEGWRDSFAAFLADMGERPGKSFEVERRDNDLGYWCGHCAECSRLSRPANCRWATRREQTRNTRVNHLITFNGKTQCLADWASEIGIGPDNLRRRLRLWTTEEALTRPPQRRGQWAK
jgi:hypothetical protein